MGKPKIHHQLELTDDGCARCVLCGISWYVEDGHFDEVPELKDIEGGTKRCYPFQEPAEAGEGE